MQKSFVEMATEKNEDFKKPLTEGMNHYSNAITRALAPIDVMDIPLIVASLDTISKELKEQYPGCVEFAKNLQRMIPHDTIIIKI